MNTDWKEQLKNAAAQEQVDYGAVAKAFMDQAYGFVANKAKALFAEPHRLGFEIVRRNEKATKMVGIFAFRVDRALLYVPVFFVNGEIRPTDMLYRSDVKRFCPLNEEWTKFLIEGAQQEPGTIVDRNSHRQPDGHIDRLLYPQMRKYASNHDGAITAYEEMTKLAMAFDDPAPLLVPQLTQELGQEFFEKVASLDASPAVLRALSEFYDLEALAAIEKSANFDDLGNLTLVSDHLLAKDAAESNKVIFDGYSLRDTRPAEVKAQVIDLSEDVDMMSRPGVYEALTADGSTIRVVVLKDTYDKLKDECPPSLPVAWESQHTPPTRLLALHRKKIYSFRSDDSLYGTLLTGATIDELIDASALQPGKVYIPVDIAGMCAKYAVRCDEKDGNAVALTSRNESKPDVFYISDRQKEAVSGNVVGTDLRFIEVEIETEKEKEGEPQCNSSYFYPDIKKIDKQFMSPAQVSAWIRRSGNSTNSNVVEVLPARDAFDIKIDGKLSARDLSVKEAHVALAMRLNIDADEALEMVRKGGAKHVLQQKSAYMTIVDPEMQWNEFSDPVFGTKVVSPEAQVLATTTPERFFDKAREGDRFEATPRSGLKHSLPDSDIFSKSPEELAQTATSLNLPSIFDHGVVGQLSGTVFDATAQVDSYIVDMEQGLDRIFRTLFLIRYRPAEFEDAFGKEALMETEQEFSELGRMMGDVVLKMIRRHRVRK